MAFILIFKGMILCLILSFQNFNILAVLNICFCLHFNQNTVVLASVNAQIQLHINSLNNQNVKGITRKMFVYVSMSQVGTMLYYEPLDAVLKILTLAPNYLLLLSCYSQFCVHLQNKRAT